MSALAGLMAGNLGAAARRPLVAAMAQTIRGRGTEPFASWGVEGEPVTLGIRQLLTLDLTPDGRQPTLSMQKPIAAVLDGYIANANLLRRELEEADVRLRGHSDAELLAESVAHVGLNRLLQKLEGAFAFALWDGESQTLHLVRDRMGARPLFVAAWEGAFAFASEPAAFTALKGFAPTLDDTAVAQFLALGYVPAPKTLFSGVMALPPGHRLMLRPTDTALPTPEAWWSPVTAIEEIALRGEPANTNGARANRLMETLADEASRLDVPYACLDDGGAGSRALKGRLAGKSDKTLRVAELHTPDAVAVQTAFDELVRLPMPYANPDAILLWHALRTVRDAAGVIMAPCDWAERGTDTPPTPPLRLPYPLARVAARLMPQRFAHLAQDAATMLQVTLGLWPNIEKIAGKPADWPIERPRMQMPEEDVATFNAFAGPFREAAMPMLDALTQDMDIEVRCPFADHRMLECHWPAPALSKADIGGWLRGPMRIRMQNTLNNGVFSLLQLKYPDPILVTWQNCLAGDNSKAHSLWGYLMLVEWASVHGLLHRPLVIPQTLTTMLS